MSEPNLIVVNADAHGQLAVEALSHALGESHPRVVQEGIVAASSILAARHTPPRYIVVDIGNRGSDVLQELDVLAHECHAGVKVVVTGHLNDVSFYRELIHRGIVEYFAYPAQIPAMVEALQSALPAALAGNNARSKQGYAISFMSAASGDGASTVAMNVAYLLANKFNRSVVLVDLDYQFGMLARHLDLQAPYGIRELLEYPERGVDSALLNKMMVPYGRNLKLVAAPPDLRKLPAVRTQQIIDLLEILKSQFDYVLFDVQHIWLDWIAALLAKSDHRVVVSQLWLRSLTHITRLMAAWKTENISPRDMSLVVNRSGAKFKEAMTAEDFERVSGLGINFYLANDTRAIVQSENQGRMLVETGGSLLDSQLLAIAQHLHTSYTGEAALPAESVKKGLLQRLTQKPQ